MSITSEIRSYADSAVSQGKQVLDQNVSGITAKAGEAVTDLRTTAEKAINIDAIKHAVEPYLTQVKGYGTLVTDRAEELFSGLTSDQRVTKLVDTAGNVTTVVLTRVQEHVVKPVQSLTGFGAPVSKPARVTRPRQRSPRPPSPPPDGPRLPRRRHRSRGHPPRRRPARRPPPRPPPASRRRTPRRPDRPAARAAPFPNGNGALVRSLSVL